MEKNVSCSLLRKQYINTKTMSEEDRRWAGASARLFGICNEMEGGGVRSKCCYSKVSEQVSEQVSDVWGVCGGNLSWDCSSERVHKSFRKPDFWPLAWGQRCWDSNLSKTFRRRICGVNLSTLSHIVLELQATFNSLASFCISCHCSPKTKIRFCIFSGCKSIKIKKLFHITVSEIIFFCSHLR